MLRQQTNIYKNFFNNKINGKVANVCTFVDTILYVFLFVSDVNTQRTTAFHGCKEELQGEIYEGKQLKQEKYSTLAMNIKGRKK